MKINENVVGKNSILKVIKNKKSMRSSYYKVLMVFISFILAFNTYATEKFIENELKDEKIGNLSNKDSVGEENNRIAQKFRLAISYSQVEHFKEAIQLFESIVEEGDSQFCESSDWYLGLCFLKSDETDKAIKKLKKIAKEENSFSKAAESILANLKSKK